MAVPIDERQRSLPYFLVRLLVWLIANTIYRIRTVGNENIPAEGALLVANHVSWVDALLIAASTDRVVRFLMFRPYYEWRGLNWFFRMMHVIPVAANDPPEKTADSLERARREIRGGNAVCIFAEGSITRTGNLLKFKRGLERIASQVNCPIVPIYLDGVWGSIFSFERGRFLFKFPKRLLEPITVWIGKAMPSTSTANEVRQAMQQLSVDAFRAHKERQVPLHVAFIRRAKQRRHRILAVQPDGSRISFGTALARAIALSRSIGNACSKVKDERIGVMMPPGIETLLAHFGVWFAGCVPVAIDTADPAPTLRTIIASSKLSLIIATRDVIDRWSTQPLPTRLVEFDELETAAGRSSVAMLKIPVLLLPARLIARFFLRGDSSDVDRVATILYFYPDDPSQPPRGAMLTHHNLLSNLESLRQVFRVTRRDCILGTATFANAMSFTGTLLLPALTGARVAYGSELVGSDALGRFCRENRVTVIPASPALLEQMIVHVAPGDVSDLRHVAVGGPPLSESLRDRFAAKFGVEPLEGYGRPECAPIISLNIPDYGAGARRQAGRRAGTAGHPLPGISVRVVNPADGREVPQGKEGELLVRGPNVMKGYVDAAESAPEMSGGWFRTGERASIDADGFLKIARLGEESR